MAVQIQIRRDTAANFTSVNPTLADGEMGFETDTKKLKFGDGVTVWTSLAYFTTPIAAHAVSHQSGGSDAIKLDDLAEPDDNTDLNVSITAHGLAPKAPNDATKYLDGTGAYSVPAGGGGGTQVIACCPFGAKSDTLGRFLVANGKSSDADELSKTKTRQPIISDGTLTKLAYQTKDGTTSTQMNSNENTY